MHALPYMADQTLCFPIYPTSLSITVYIPHTLITQLLSHLEVTQITLFLPIIYLGSMDRSL